MFIILECSTWEKTMKLFLLKNWNYFYCTQTFRKGSVSFRYFTKVEVQSLSTVKNIFTPPLPHRLFMLLPVLRQWSHCCSYSVWLCGLYYGALHVLKSPRARGSSFLLALWKRELVCVLLVHLFVCFVHVSFCNFSLPLGITGWLQFVIETLPGLFY